MNQPGDLPLSALPPARAGRAPQRSSDRLRWGLTGLAAIFLIVLIAAAGLRPGAGDDKRGSGEALAVLGVAPGPATRPPEP